MSVQSVIPCPDCGSNIHIDSNLLLAGQSFKCTNQSCTTSISIQPQEVPVVSEAIDKFENLKEDALTKGQEASVAADNVS